MNLKKTLSMMLSVAMILSSMCVFASTDVVYPTDLATELTGAELTVNAIKAASTADYWDNKENPEEITLDFGMAFSANEAIELAEKNDYYGYKVDFELSFDKDVTAILAGQYDDSSWWDEENWIAITEEGKDGITFAANEPIRLMETMGMSVCYKDVLQEIKNFNCGIKFAYDAPNDVTATLKLIMIPANEIKELPENVKCEYCDDDRNLHYTIVYTNGDRRCYDYHGEEKEAEVINTVSYTHNRTFADQVADINASAAEIDSKEEAANVKAIIAELPQEEKANLDVKTVKAIVEAETLIDEEAITVPTVFNTDLAVEVSIEKISYGVVEEFMDKEVVYEVTTNTGATEVDVPVLVAIPVADPAAVEEVLHKHGDVIESLPFDEGNGVIYVQMSKFSQITLVMANALVSADEAELKFVPATADERGTAKFDLVLAGASPDAIKGLVSGQFTLAPVGASASFDYELTAVEDLELTYNELEDGKREYLIGYLEGAFDKLNSYTVTEANNNEYKIATLVVRSYGTGRVDIKDVELWQHDYSNTVENLEKAINVVNTVSAQYDIAVPTQKLTIEINFAHATETNKKADYEQMTVEVKGADFEKTFKLGNDTAADGVMRSVNKYAMELDLLADGEYSIVVKGAGYRTARYTGLNMGQEDRLVAFWNNAKDYTAAMEYIVNGSALTPVSTAKEYSVNFLAGDIVMDNIINIYDLSAVVSYFGETGLNENNKATYAKYDLNRDGEIDSLDVAILLNSWNK